MLPIVAEPSLFKIIFVPIDIFDSSSIELKVILPLVIEFVSITHPPIVPDVLVIDPVKDPDVAVIVPVMFASVAVNNPVEESRLNLTTSTLGLPSITEALIPELSIIILSIVKDPSSSIDTEPNVPPAADKSPEKVPPAASRLPEKVPPAADKSPEKVPPAADKSPEKVPPAAERLPLNIASPLALSSKFSCAITGSAPVAAPSNITCPVISEPIVIVLLSLSKMILPLLDCIVVALIVQPPTLPSFFSSGTKSAPSYV
jgi:hypothetical protein